MPVRVLFKGGIPAPQMGFLERLLQTHFRHSLGAVDVEIHRATEAEAGTGYVVTRAKKWVFDDQNRASRQTPPTPPPFFVGDVIQEVETLLERHQADLARLDRTFGRDMPLALPATATARPPHDARES